MADEVSEEFRMWLAAKWVEACVKGAQDQNLDLVVTGNEMMVQGFALVSRRDDVADVRRHFNAILGKLVADLQQLADTAPQGSA